MNTKDALDFYWNVYNTFVGFAKNLGVKDYNRYLNLTDYDELSLYQRVYKLSFEKNELNYIFAQLAYHAQNGGLLVNIIKFDVNYQKIKKIMCDFDVDKFLELNENKNAFEMANLFYDNGITWNKEKKSNKDIPPLVGKYGICLINCAKYLRNHRTKSEMLNDLINHEDKENPEKLIDYFIQEVAGGKGNQYSIKLTCDFIKEFDIHFNYLCKPDTHVKRSIEKLYGEKYKDYNKQDLIKVIKHMMEIVDIVKKEAKIELSVYELDRMIYINGSGNFFLHKIWDRKKEYKPTF